MKTPKYSFVESEGCRAFYFTVNGKTLEEITEQEHGEILDYLLQKVKEESSARKIRLCDIVSLFEASDREYSPEPCETCGDTIQKTTWEI